jgi:acetyltransferase-like isoleucine patch superfamily enzyme/acyl carrier protein
MSRLKWWIVSDHWLPRTARAVRRAILHFSLPAPAVIVRPLLAVFLVARAIHYFLLRVFICEPLFKAYCTRYGRGVRTGVYIHWVAGRGELILGDEVLIDGKCSFDFAVRYSDRPSIEIGSHTVVGHGTSFTAGRRITVGRHCLIAGDVAILDAPGHPTDPELRKSGAPANPEDVRPVAIQDNVWIGRKVIVFPGVTIGEGSVIVAGAMVTTDVPAYTILAGNPGRVIGRLRDGNSPAAAVNRSARAPMPESSATSLNAVMGILREVLGTDELAPDEDFFDAGLTSIMVLPLLVELEQRFGLAISEGDILDARTGLELASLIDRLAVESARR